MGLSSEVLSYLVGSIYEAAASPALWPRFLEQLKAIGVAERSFLMLSTAGQCDLSLQSGFEPSSVRAYETYYHTCDHLLIGYVERVKQHGAWVGTDASVVSREDFYRTEGYNDYMRKNGDAFQCGLALLAGTRGDSMGLSLLRTEAQGDFGEAQVSLLAALSPHLTRAVALHRNMMQLRAEKEDLRESVEAFGVAMVSVAADGRVIRMTEPARRLLETKDGLELLGGRLSAAVPGEASRLAELILGAAATGSGDGLEQGVQLEHSVSPQASAKLWSAPAGGAMLVSRRAPRKPLRVLVSPFRSEELLLVDRPAALLFLSDPDVERPSKCEMLRSLYGLTPAEARVAEMVAAGMEVAAIAEQLTLSRDTVRFYLKATFRKTGTRRQSDLVRVVASLPDGLASLA